MTGEYQVVKSFKAQCRRITPDVNSGIWANFAKGPMHTRDNYLKYVDTDERRVISSGGLYTDLISWCCGVALAWPDKVALTHIVPPGTATGAATEIERQAKFFGNANIKAPTSAYLAQMHAHSMIFDDGEAIKSSLYVAAAALKLAYGEGVWASSTYLTGYKGVESDTSCTLTVTVLNGVSIIIPGLRPAG